MKTRWTMPRTTVGRFWGYVSIAIALSVSLAGNVRAAYLHDPNPSWVDIGFAGIPPLTAFLSIEVVNHNPWQGTGWGPRVKTILLGVVTPASAIVSFIHLATVVLHGRETVVWNTVAHSFSTEALLTWITAALTALLIDGLMFGGTAALLLPKVQPVPDVPLVLTRVPDWRAEMERALAALQPVGPKSVQPLPEPVKTPEKPRQPRPERPGQKRFAPREHPLWDEWALDQSSAPWTPERFVAETKKRMGDDLTVAAARIKITRWEAELAKSTTMSVH